MGADMGPFWKQGLCACGMMTSNLRDRKIRVEKECSSTSDSLTMGFPTANPCLCLGLTEEVQGVASKEMLCHRCSVGFVRIRKEGVREQMNRMPFQVGNVPPALQRAFVIQLLSEVLLDLQEINDAFFKFHVLWHVPQTTCIQIVWGVGQNCWLLGPIPQLLNQNFTG